jgi:hypothetical protein
VSVSRFRALLCYISLVPAGLRDFWIHLRQNKVRLSAPDCSGQDFGGYRSSKLILWSRRIVIAPITVLCAEASEARARQLAFKRLQKERDRGRDCMQADVTSHEWVDRTLASELDDLTW